MSSFIVALAMMGSIAPPPDAVIAPLPRICPRDGRFVEKVSGKTFHPAGFHYIRILPEGPHYVFAPTKYDPDRAEAMLSDLERHGFNVVRVFLGALELTQGDALSEEFVDNLADFITRATRHRVYVLPVVDWLPPSNRYKSILANARPDVGGMQAMFMDAAHTQSKKLYLIDLIGMLKKRIPTLLSTVFAYELENEVNADLTCPPFSQASGSFAYKGKTYNLANDRALQKLLDAAIIDNANALVAAIRTEDPDAMAAYSVFTYAAVGRSGPGKMRSDTSPDTRCPIRPLALARSDLSYVDLHFYAPSPEGFRRDMEAVEWNKLTSVCRTRGKPILAGEYGVPSPLASTGEQAASIAVWHANAIREQGLEGGIFWTYDCHEQRDVINAKQFDGAIFDALAAFHRRRSSP
ncbi:MAG TPA: cellulase family glycosylhydrolase [Candidatus Hydrogenedentes bacterium]|nr:cellulase family glycosylhydrolase [Candidatus Hydrogenedentota bacterium]